MSFEMILQHAQEGDPEAKAKIVEMYKPLLIKHAIVEGVFDEDLYQELNRVLLYCIKKFRFIG